jgi:hypothetical protein
VTVLELACGAAVLSLPDGCNWLSQSFRLLFKRDFYDTFITNVLRSFVNSDSLGGDRVVVMGTPGIGKSSFALYAVYSALQMGKSVVYQHHETNHIYTVLYPGNEFATIYSQQSNPVELENPNNVFVVDGITPRNAKAFTLLVSSPNHSRVFEWSKANAATFYLPIWTFEELKLMSTHCFGGFSKAGIFQPVELTNEVLWERYEMAGGVPRHVFLEAKWRELRVTLKQSAIATLESIDKFTSDQSSVFEVSHRTVHLIVNRSTLMVESLDFASPLARQYVYEAVRDKHRATLLSFMKSTQSEMSLASFRDMVHENFVASFASRNGGTWVARSLSMDGDARLTIPLSAIGIVRTFCDLKELTPGEVDVPILWRPQVKNFPSTDLILTVGISVFFFSVPSPILMKL